MVESPPATKQVLVVGQLTPLRVGVAQPTAEAGQGFTGSESVRQLTPPSVVVASRAPSPDAKQTLVPGQLMAQKKPLLPASGSLATLKLRVQVAPVSLVEKTRPGAPTSVVKQTLALGQLIAPKDAPDTVGAGGLQLTPSVVLMNVLGTTSAKQLTVLEQLIALYSSEEAAA
jgi:hypothetical protein